VIPKELEAMILRLHHAERWPVGTIATQLRVHHDVVERVLLQDGVPRPQQLRASIIDPYVPFIQETWAKYPRLPASRLFEMCRSRGFPGKPDYFRQRVACYRPKPRAEAYLRLRTLPGEQAQADWAHFGKITIGRATRALMAFVLVLAWSRALFVRFFLGQQTENFLRGHEAAFSRWDGVVRLVLYDNLKSAVLERIGDAIRFNPTLLEFSAHYRYEPRPVAPGRGNEKPRVERAIRYIRTGFFLARKWKDLDDLNHQVEDWCLHEAMDRRFPDDPRRTVRDAFEEERAHLLPLPAVPFPTDERREVPVGKTPYVRFDGNDYSVPYELVHQTLVVFASLDEVRIFRGSDEVARHRRSFDRGAQIEDPTHIQALVESKQRARRHRGMDRLAHATPSSRKLLERIAERGKNLGSATQRLLRLLDAYGAESLEEAIREVVARDVCHLHAVRQVLERNREARGKPPATALLLPDDPRIRDLCIRPHPLASYDEIGRRAVNSE